MNSHQNSCNKSMSHFPTYEVLTQLHFLFKKFKRLCGHYSFLGKTEWYSVNKCGTLHCLCVPLDCFRKFVQPRCVL